MTLNPVELAKQGAAFQQLQKDYQSYRPNFEKLDEIGSKLVEVESFARLIFQNQIQFFLFDIEGKVPHCIEY